MANNTDKSQKEEVVSVQFNVTCFLVKDKEGIYHPSSPQNSPLSLDNTTDGGAYPSAMKMDLAMRDNTIYPNTVVKMYKSEAEDYLKATHIARGHKMGQAKTYIGDPMLYDSIPVAELVA